MCDTYGNFSDSRPSQERSDNSADVVRKFYKMCAYHQKNIIKAKHEPSELLMMLMDQKPLKDCMELALHIIFAMTGDEVSYKTCIGFLKKYQVS